MADDCVEKLAGNFVKACGFRPKAGILRKWYINYDDIDRVATQLANKGTKITLLVLKAGKKIYSAGGPDTVHKANHALSVLDFGNGHIHTDNFTILYDGESEMERVQELVEGARVVTIIERVNGGKNGETTYQILGYESGMKITEHTWNSDENSGSVLVTVATKEGEEESTGKKIFLVAAGVAATRTFIETNTYVESAPEPEE